MDMRRAERQVLALADISGILSRCEVGHLGLVDAEGPYVVPLSFVHVVRDGRIVVYTHGAGEGRKIKAVTTGGRLCFEADRRVATVSGPQVCKLTATYESVIGQGTGRIVTDPTEAREAMRLMVEKYAPGRGDELPDGPPPHVTMLAFDLDEATGKSYLE